MKWFLPFLLAFTLMDCGHIERPIPEKNLVICYVGTEEHLSGLAQDIATDTDADLFYIEAEFISSQEYELAQNVPDHFSDYGTVYFGYDTWGEKPAQPALLFLQRNDLSQKIWYPFTIADQKEADATLPWLNEDGMRPNWHTPKGFSRDAGQEQVKAWLDSLSQ